MLKKLLEQRGTRLTKEEFETICEMVTDDIKFNRIGFKKCTNLNEILKIIERSINVLKSCE